MRKVITAKEMGRAEKLAYQAGARDTDFMAAAGKGVAGFAHRFVAETDCAWSILLLCGKGNNGGDGYVAGVDLLKRGYTVRALQLAPIQECSPLCRQRYEEFRKAGGQVVDVRSKEDLQLFPEGVIIDAILGTGFRGTVEGLFAAAIERANDSGLPILAIDIPSGISGNTGEVATTAIRATTTLYLGVPKTGFFIGTGWGHLGTLHRVEFGLGAQFLDQAHVDLLMMVREDARQRLPPLVRDRHKYQAGYVVGLAGSALMPGAAVLTGFSALRGGAGIVRMLYPSHMERPSYAPEILAQPCTTAQDALEVMNHASAALIGPGLGTGEEAAGLVGGVLEGLQKPCVIDADGLNLLNQSPSWKLPQQTILTPHVGEMCRLLGVERSERPRGLEWLSACQAFSSQKGATLIVKGSPTVVFDAEADDPPTVIPRGDPGMATAGCGDVLTGLLAALLSQGLVPLDAARLGAYLHAVAGEEAAKAKTAYSMVASDVSDHLMDAFKELADAST